jgi:hypothetical protein
MHSWDGSGGDLAQESLEFSEGHLDRIKVGGILRQIAKGRSRGLEPRERRRLCGLEAQTNGRIASVASISEVVALIGSQ